MQTYDDIILPLSRHRLEFLPTISGRWPRYAGSAWRGGFGHALKRVVCVMRTAHNSIDRLRGTTPDTGGLFFQDEWWPAEEDRHRDLYLATDLPLAEVEALVAAVGGWGFGRDAGTGRGRFRVDGAAADPALLAHAGNRLLSLSHGCHGPGMTAARWRLWTHFGKVGAEVVARGGRPWKRPVLLFRPGCTFRPDGPGPFGGWLDTIYQDADKVGFTPGLNAWHLAVPYAEAGA